LQNEAIVFAAYHRSSTVILVTMHGVQMDSIMLSHRQASVDVVVSCLSYW